MTRLPHAAKLSLGVLAIGLLTTTANADTKPKYVDPPIGHQFVLKSFLPGDWCMDASLDAGKAGHEVYIYKCHGKFNQRWTVIQDAPEKGDLGPTFSLVGFDGKCLDVQGAKVGDETPLILYPCHLHKNQRFSVTAAGRIIETQSGKCVTVSAAGDRKAVYIDECDEQKAKQTWKIATTF